MELKRLGDYVNIKTGKLDANASSENGKYPFFTCSVNNLWIDNFAYDCECVLIAGNGDLNVKYYEGKFNAYQRTYIVESDDKNILDVRYVYYFMSKYIDILRNNSIGGVIKYIKLGDLTEVFIPIPKLETQKKIVEVLDKAQGLIDARKEQIRLMDELIQSVFYEMFGDPVTNPKGWEEVSLDSMCKVIHRYPTFYGFDYIETGTPVIRIGDINFDGSMNEDLSQYAYINQSITERFPLTQIKINDILMAVRGDGSTAKRIGIVRDSILEGAQISPNLLRIEVNTEKSNATFVYTLLTSVGGQAKLDTKVNKTAKKNIKAKDIKEMKFIYPKIDLQNRFEQIVNKIGLNKGTLLDSLFELELNHKSIVQKAFSGEYFGGE